MEELKKAIEEICAHLERYPAEKVVEKEKRFREEKMVEGYMKLLEKELYWKKLLGNC